MWFEIVSYRIFMLCPLQRLAINYSVSIKDFKNYKNTTRFYLSILV